MMQNIILPFKSPTDTRTYNIIYKAPCKSCQCKMLQTCESSSEQFPCIMVHLESPPPTLFLQCWPSHCVLPASGTISSSHHSITSSVAPTRDLYSHSGPWTFICLGISKSSCPVPFNAPCFSSPSSLLCLVYTWLLACPLSFQPLKAFQAANKRQVPTTTKGLSAAFE